jgi:hypothetical protein
MVETARCRRFTNGSQGVAKTREAPHSRSSRQGFLSGSNLFEFYLYFIVRDRDPKALNARSNTVNSLLKGYGVDVDAPPIQGELT